MEAWFRLLSRTVCDNDSYSSCLDRHVKWSHLHGVAVLSPHIMRSLRDRSDLPAQSKDTHSCLASHNGMMFPPAACLMTELTRRVP